MSSLPLQYGITRNLLLICILFFQSTNSFCPSKCQCNVDHNLRVSCINAGLEVVPIQLNPDIKYINLTLNQILNVHFTLQFYTQLEVLDLSKNKIDDLGSRNFEAQNQLKTVNLSRNSITHLKKDAFRGLKSLILLDLSYNQITAVHFTAMHDLSGLIEINLAGNSITSLDDGIFRNLISLEILNFENNQLLDVPMENLMYTKNLRSLDLSGNLIEFVRNDSFESLKQLTSLKITGNVVNELEQRAFDGLLELRTLNLADNNLTVVPTLQLSKLSNLSHLSMSGNCFTHLPPVALLNLFHLKELHLNRLDRLVKIDSRAFVDNTFLQTITLDDNPSFGDLPARLFHGNPNLVEISMRGNDLRTLDAAQFPLDRLQRLYLSDNPLECNCSLLWLWRLTTGQYDEENTNTTNILVLDKDKIGCDIWEERKIRRVLKTMSESEIKCPAHIVTIISAVMSILLVVMTGISVLCYMRMVRKKKKALAERKNVNKRVIPQPIDKLELERYLAAQEMEHEYRALRPWEIPVNKLIEEPDHYEKFDDFRFDSRRSNKQPHVVFMRGDKIGVGHTRAVYVIQRNRNCEEPRVGSHHQHH